MAKLSKKEIDQRLPKLDGWVHDADAITKKFTFESFPDAIAFVVRLAFDCELADHHPDIFINYRRVTLSYSTHAEGGLTAKDFDGAEAAERLIRGL